ncbi:eEF1A lysine and N-terminal methyltransferase [Scyliorhinus canicula]|uniref:eEF1A lysine and N-terminal methyltransferase n=1 Tax=Scyliorhinus canicula TaxID=7830 RepID=UPI0018F5CAB4|nr:eEF1A lysine and N-terminal methyltransferase [Scyliorhinus canicula]XP_038650888.1 eEF1A lysine and N-terminal methyltransferase [Scyliorhinus canicula]XP_038650889.1 eEF1A lysine and N-terminal methyltransferase [Scyliorhinus canicula]
MNLLPKSSKEFSSAEYWETFFKKRGACAFEWYGTYVDHCAVLHKYIKPKDKVLVVGCGNSELSEQMYDVGYHGITNIDISEVVIDQMKERNATRRPTMAFMKMDMMQMEFGDSQFQVVLDKGTLDAVMTDESDGTLHNVDRMFAEIGRVLQVGGRFVCISLAQEHIAKKAMSHFLQQGWPVRIHTVEEQSTANRQSIMPVFIFIFTKFKKIPGADHKILEMFTEEQGKPLRLDSVEQLLEAVKGKQQYALLRNHLTKNSSSGENVSLTLCDSVSGKSRYTFYIVDLPIVKASRTNYFAIFIVPQGRETEWLFGSDEGRRQLGKSAEFKRLLVVGLHRDQFYESMEAIQSELSGKVMELAPSGLPPNQQVPFLSVGGDIGVRTIQCRGTSDMSGEYVIEDVKGEDGNYFRHLVFLSNVNVVQSEAKLFLHNVSKSVTLQKKKKKEKRRGRPCAETDKTSKPRAGQAVDKSYLCCDHHRAMIAGLVLLSKKGDLLADTPFSLLVVGLGGGSLPSFIHDYFSQSTVDAIEIDPVMLEVATTWFEFSQDERMKVILADGLNYIRTVADSGNGSYDVIMFDVDSKDTTLGMSCPPPAFVDGSFLQKVRNLLAPQGLFILNLVCRDSALKEKVMKAIKGVFPLIYLQKIEGEVNEILYCQLTVELKTRSKDLLEAGQILENTLKKHGRYWDQTYNLAEMLKTITIV